MNSVSPSRLKVAKRNLNSAWRALSSYLKKNRIRFACCRETHTGRCLLGSFVKARTELRSVLTRELDKIKSPEDARPKRRRRASRTKCRALQTKIVELNSKILELEAANRKLAVPKEPKLSLLTASHVGDLANRILANARLSEDLCKKFLQDITQIDSHLKGGVSTSVFRSILETPKKIPPKKVPLLQSSAIELDALAKGVDSVKSGIAGMKSRLPPAIQQVEENNKRILDYLESIRSALSQSGSTVRKPLAGTKCLKGGDPLISFTYHKSTFAKIDLDEEVSRNYEIWRARMHQLYSYCGADALEKTFPKGLFGNRFTASLREVREILVGDKKLIDRRLFETVSVDASLIPFFNHNQLIVDEIEKRLAERGSDDIIFRIKDLKCVRRLLEEQARRTRGGDSVPLLVQLRIYPDWTWEVPNGKLDHCQSFSIHPGYMQPSVANTWEIGNIYQLSSRMLQTEL